MAITPELVASLDDILSEDLTTEGRLGRVQRYLVGEHDLPYMPKGAKEEYRVLATKSITNWTPLISDTYAKALFVDGYRQAKAAENSSPWSYWQANGLDARQSIAHRGALEYGASYVLVLPGTLGTKRVPVIRPLDPLRSAAWYADPDDEFPEVAILRKGETTDGTRLLQAFDREAVYTFAKPKEKDGATEPEKWLLSKTELHDLGVTPWVRFRERLDGESRGVIRPILPLQDRVNDIVFSTMIALQFAAFRQRWATGLVIPEDEDGNPVEPFKAAVDRLWVAEEHEAKFGDFAQTDIQGHQSAYTLTVKSLAAIAQVSPNILTGDLVNLNAEALAQMEQATQRKVGEYETLFGEAWEGVFRLAAKAAGDATAAADSESQVRWRDTEARSLAQTVDAWGKVAQMLQVPVEALWEKIPGVTQQDVDYWKTLRDSDPLVALTTELTKQTDTSALDAPAETAPPTAVDDAAAVKAKGDALGGLVRAGATFESAVRVVGLEGLENSGAVPVTLRLPEEDAADLEGGSGASPTPADSAPADDAPPAEDPLPVAA